MKQEADAQSGPRRIVRRTITAHDVAREAGVSQSAVSRSFTDGASVSPDTRRKVQEAAGRLGYRPNLIARSMITGRSNIIGVAMSYLGNQFYPEVLHALSAALRRTDRRILLFATEMDGDSDPILDEVLRYRVDALVLASATLSSHAAREYRQAGLPVVTLNRKTDDTSVSSVTGDNVGGARALAAFLIAGGHSRFAFIAGLPDSSTSRDRETGFTARLVEDGFGPPLRIEGGYDFDRARQAARELFSAPTPPDAIFCANDHMALAVIETARAEFGLSVGRDVSVVGFDDAGPAAWPSFQLTTYVQPVQAMVDCVAAIIDQQMRTPHAPPVQAVIPGALIVRASARLPADGLSGPPGRRIWLAPTG